MLQTGPTAYSPEMEQRLQAQFPVGTPESVLTAALTKQGFTLDPPCKDDPSIRQAHYRQPKYGLYQAVGAVYWKVDADQRILWTHGNVAFVGL